MSKSIQALFFAFWCFIVYVICFVKVLRSRERSFIIPNPNPCVNTFFKYFLKSYLLFSQAVFIRLFPNIIYEIRHICLAYHIPFWHIFICDSPLFFIFFNIFWYFFKKILKKCLNFFAKKSYWQFRGILYNEINNI